MNVSIKQKDGCPLVCPCPAPATTTSSFFASLVLELSAPSLVIFRSVSRMKVCLVSPDENHGRLPFQVFFYSCIWSSPAKYL